MQNLKKSHLIDAVCIYLLSYCTTLYGRLSYI
jgi:hypothetical protein